MQVTNYIHNFEVRYNNNYCAGDSNMDTPISLADLCYLHIISHLKQYPLHHLAKLSYPVRRKLLQNLPACDIVELENTCVADGIGDLESEVWQQYCARQRLYVESGLGPRKSFFEAILSRLFSSCDDDLRRWLFSVPECLSIADLTSFTSVTYKDLARLVPHRYAALCDPDIKSRCDIHAWVILFLNKAGFKPTNIRANGGFAIDTNSRYMSDLSVLVSAVDTVELLAEDNRLLSLIKAICMNERPMLRSLTVSGNDFTQMCMSVLLESSSVIGLEKLHCTLPTGGSGHSHLVEFLSGQANMKELELINGGIKHSEASDGNFCKRDQQWVSCVGNLLMRPDFELCQVQWTMNCAGVTQCAFTELMNFFLSAPASKQKKIDTNSFNVKICECYAHKAVTPCIVGDNSLEYKEAIFGGGFDYDQFLLDPILMCLSNFTIQLKRLDIQCYFLEDTSLFTAVFSNPSFAVSEVCIWHVVLPIKFTSESDFHFLDALLSKPSLKIFEFSGLEDEEGRLESLENELKMVTNALIKQASVGTLESFIYDEFEASLQGISGDKEFVRAILCLPQFLQLNFSLRYPSELADMANEFWVECANGRTLKPPPPNCSNCLLEVMLGLTEI